MTQADIKRLMDELNFPAFNAWGYELMLKLYQHAQREAYEKAAQLADELQLPDMYSQPCVDDLAEAIRKLKEESCKS